MSTTHIPGWQWDATYVPSLVTTPWYLSDTPYDEPATDDGLVEPADPDLEPDLDPTSVWAWLNDPSDARSVCLTRHSGVSVVTYAPYCTVCGLAL